jgi:hypothetical protein
MPINAKHPALAVTSFLSFTSSLTVALLSHEIAQEINSASPIARKTSTAAG